MIFSEELYFEISLSGKRRELDKMVNFLVSGELDDFFPVCEDYICYDDAYDEASAEEDASFVFTNDDIGVEIDEFDVDEFLEVFCRAARNLDIRGRLYDAEEEEYSFVSREGDAYYLNSDKIDVFNDELDEHAAMEEDEEEESDR